MNVSYRGGLSIHRDSKTCYTYFDLGSYGVDCKQTKKCVFRINAYYIPTDPETPIMPRPIYLNSENAAIGAAMKLLLHLCNGGNPEDFSAGDGLAKGVHRPRGRPRKS